jgi:hypothetical protein
VIPTRTEIIAKIAAIKADPAIQTVNYRSEVIKWLQSLNLAPVIVAGQTIDPVVQITDDLESYGI